MIFLTETKCKIRFIYLGFKAGQLEWAMMCDNEICLLFTWWWQLPGWWLPHTWWLFVCEMYPSWLLSSWLVTMIGNKLLVQPKMYSFSWAQFQVKTWLTFADIIAKMWLVTGWPTSIEDSQSTLFWKHVQHRYWVNTQYMQQTTHLLLKDLVDPGIWVEFASDDGNGTGGPGPLLLKNPGYAGSHLLYNLVLVEGHGFTFVICSYPVILLILESLCNSIKIKQLKSEIG